MPVVDLLREQADVVAKPVLAAEFGAGGSRLTGDVVLMYLVVALFAMVIVFAFMRMQDRQRDCLRYALFVVLHISDYASNVMMMIIVWSCGHYRYLFMLGPTHMMVGLFCIYTAATSTDWQNWACAPLCNFVFMVIVLGLMQGVQIKLAHEDYKQQQALHNDGVSSDLQMPSMMPSRFFCKTMDGILEGTVFSLVGMYALLKRHMKSSDVSQVMYLEAWQILALYFTAFVSFITTGMALMEVDHRTSAAVQRLLNQSTFAQVRHLVFRSTEFMLRVLTMLVFLTFMRRQGIWFLAAVAALVLDYVFGVLLLIGLGGRDPVRQAAVILGIPLLVVNVMQFVDTPGMSLQARRISSIIVPFRLLELLCVVMGTMVWSTEVDVCNDYVKDCQDFTPMTTWTYLLEYRFEWVLGWLLSGVTYVVLLLTYACGLKPEADLHSAVAYGEVDRLHELLHGSELTLDINRYGPDGRTPLHLAAARGQVDCMRLLIEDRANLHARTGDRLRNTALHLAAAGKSPAAVRFLCKVSGGDTALMNATNADGDTPLHAAARRQNVAALQELLKVPHVNVRVKNNKGLTAADCAPSDKFGFDRNSPECAIADLLRNAECGKYSGANTTSGVELSSLDLDRFSTGADVENNRSARASDAPDVKVTTTANDCPEELGAAKTAPDSAQHAVPLQSVPRAEEEEFLKRTQGQTLPKSRPNGELATHCGISSFMLSAGLGALSRAVLSSIKEEPDQGCANDQNAVVKAGFDDFAEIKPLGEGAFGKVLLVRQKETGELFAMKTMDKAKFRAQKITSKAHSEQYILKTTRHPFIVSLHYAFQGTTFWALVMDYCPNGDLQKYLGAHGCPGLHLPEAARLGGEVLLAVEHLHSIRVIFRDLKLENVVLDPDYRAKVTDFGLAKKLYTIADARTMCGSYGYAAPEIMLNAGRYTYAVDLYSYGVMMYLLLSGGEPAQNNPRQRLPPMRHSGLKRRLKDAEKEPRPNWAAASAGGLALVQMLTSEDPRVRTTATEVKEHSFFRQQLQRSVDALLEEDGKAYGPSTLPSK